MPLLQRRELLQRERVHLAELVKLALRVLRTPLLRFPVIGDGELALVRPWHEDIRAVLGDEHIPLRGEVGQRPSGDLLELQLPGSPGDLGAVRAVDHLLQFIRNVPDPGPDRLQLAVSALVRLLGLLPVGVGRGRRLLDPGQHDPRASGHGAGDHGPGGPALRPRQRPRRSLSLGDGRRHQRVGAAGDRPLPFLDGAHLQPGFHLGAPRGDSRIG